jgi:hypothetical protein
MILNTTSRNATWEWKKRSTRVQISVSFSELIGDPAVDMKRAIMLENSTKRSFREETLAQGIDSKC